MAQTSKEQQIEKMGKLKLYELVNHYHIGTELTCAEAMFKACNEYYNLNLSEETRKMFSVMGLGMQTEQSCCGAFTVAVVCDGVGYADRAILLWCLYRCGGNHWADDRKGRTYRY